ncbi:carbohydrate kinase family protein [Yeosuana sp. MJ-SS3]|uniref:Carbohydrate kinase family protein n=1 Tax=Gilvirhabdus luticola TaxID=3079858 RepID=A0ABU3U6M9_9FLAO|nr:carbohydrate kinase family protein [Yeosuana sp. MJ-SS3]MDU8886058.1 carbohydrate kinase family protein [Yeosuana sp. MJ-SS3]
MKIQYKIAVVGPIPNDTIITYKGETITKFGCVTHPTIALANLLENTGEVIPITQIHKKDHQAILELFSNYNNINTNGIYNYKDQGTAIELRFVDQNNRIEKQIANMSPITAKDVSPFLDVDCFVFVPITDFEIELETLHYIKNNSDAQIIFDAHGPTSYVTNDGRRLRKYWNDKDDWFKYIDVLKMNLEESICSWFDNDYTSEELYDENQTEHLDEFAEYVLDKGVKTLFVTLDSRGCVIYSKNSNEITKEFVTSVPVTNVIDTTGCGDSFAGGLAYGFTAYNNAKKAAQYANVLGALRTQGKGFDVFRSLEETEAIIAKHY